MRILPLLLLPLLPLLLPLRLILRLLPLRLLPLLLPPPLQLLLALSSRVQLAAACAQTLAWRLLYALQQQLQKLHGAVMLHRDAADG